MAVARVSTMVLFVSGLVAVGILLAPSVGLWRHPRACIWVSTAGAAVAVAVVAIQVALPLTQGLLLSWPGDYFLAMAHSLKPDVPYPFFWSYGWAYLLGTLTPLIAAGGVFASGAGYPAVQAGARAAVVPFVIGIGAVLAYAVGAALTAAWTWHGIPV
jgi:hypothetical protein